jgi:hypothetical protein
MGVYYAWVCDEQREYFDPMDLPYFGNKWEAIPHSAWAVAVLALRRWSGCAIRLISDSSSDEYYELLGSGDDPPGRYTNVTAWALGAALEHKAIPEISLRKMAIDELGAVRAETLPLDQVEAALVAKHPAPAW